ncbi:ribonucleoside-diphosphate reductase, adenosylcobalamin-dependent [Candidatus Woesebacteria bacterium RIFCSPLOWO2_01_FULL_39_21]|uniref:Vitamin B12-dependent ribonucleotide reductase n=1 Tax=Candidatus Woesebacteria bacterium RIFCSPLOWO2_01_FULL_39_21 TaxID=1802519 RepID=A0A1F8BH17_9BACT|nr:MAG: ribonucleoside-diphosphate reductase, adenosylcobalamin-dependent [Candidatus Woesebacteria bacterium RIFCSPHIGHO2_01_FULL_39_23]OGM63323.1 MAG: ribonucleoside-diphosphate reductase, adenosylcobalamin-dependent [Candidatus Woesebacteria bacterium RIFCSPLOWO2_01_FULL_39_21]
MPKDLSEVSWSEQALRVLRERYFLKDDNGNPIETVREMCWRVAWELSRAEVKFGKGRREVINLAREFYNLLASRNFLPNSPTLMNAGKSNGMQYNGCYVIPVGDSLIEIFDAVKWQAVIHQSGGGTGFSFSRLRPGGSRVKSSMGVASGPVSFLKVYNEATQQIKQGGTRRGANMGILRVDHPDIMQFIHCKEDGGITNFNISVAITDRFMQALAKDEEYNLVDPHTKKVAGKLIARKVWDEIAEGAWKTGDPGLVFIDRINQTSANPIRAEGWEVESTNPCGEQPLYPFDACNLGSIFLKYFVKDGGRQVDWEKLRETVHLSVRLMDNVIEMNPIPLPQISDTVRKIRRIGLGVGGWADMLTELGIPYDSVEALTLGEKIMKFINEEGHKASSKLAEERGAFPMFKQSIYAKDKPIRNSTITTIAPTGSIGILADSSGGIEPLFAVAYRHVVKSENRELDFTNPFFEKVARERGFYSDEIMRKVIEHGTVRDIQEIPEDVRRIFGTAHEIHPDWHVKMQAAFQKYTDNAVSKTINLPNNASIEDIKRAYMLSWETGCRGITVFRDGCKGDQVLNLGVKDSKKDVVKLNGNGVIELPTIKPRPLKVEGATYKIATPLGNAFITVNHDSDGNPFEVFIAIGKAGSEVAAMADALARVISTTLRFGNHLPAIERAQELVDQLRGIGGSGSVGFGHERVRSLPDAVAKAMGMHFGLAGYQRQKDVTSVTETPEALTQLTLGNGNGNAQNGQMKEVFIDNQNNLFKHRDFCPSCGEASLVFEEGCRKCYGCGYAEC